jgi:hypothetical protein
LFLIFAATLLVSDQLAEKIYHRPPQLMKLVDQYESRTPGTHVVVFGTCLGDAMQPEAVEQTWQKGKIYNLSFKGSTALEWYLILHHSIQNDPDLAAVVVVMGGNDLHLRSSPWESQILDLATWADLPDLMRNGCTTPGCAVELAARKASFTYRARAFLALQVWKSLRTDLPGIPSMPVNGQDAVLNPEHLSLAIQESNNLPTADTSNPAMRLPNTDQTPAQETGGPDWHAQSSWFERDASFWTRKLMEEARNRGLRIAFVPLPKNPRVRAPDWTDVRGLIAEGGGEFWDPGPVAGLGADDYLDDVHFNQGGLWKMGLALGQLLHARLP